MSKNNLSAGDKVLKEVKSCFEIAGVLFWIVLALLVYAAW